MKLNRTIIKVGGESGQGVNSIGEMLVMSLKNYGYYVFGYREYPSLIRGGFACYQIDFSDKAINSSSESCDLFIGMSRVAIHKYLKTINENGIIIHWMKRFKFSEEEESLIKEKNIKIIYVEADKLVEDLGGKRIMINSFLVGMAWSVLGLEIETVREGFKKQFESKPEILDINIKILEGGYNYSSEIEINSKKEVEYNIQEKQEDSLLMTGNHALSLGAISAGTRAFYAYPMTPASSILTYLANTYHKTGVLVKQAEDEITAIQMTLGSMHMGTRALVATSGGGFDLMTESISMSAINEIPLVCVIAQRPGPGTGVPTWTAAADLNIAVYSAHGEYTRCVIAASDVKTAYTVIQNAFNIAEKYQIPVMVLTEKQIAESWFNVDKLPEPIEIKRGLVGTDKNPFSSTEGNLSIQDIKASDRFKITENGISPRWLPGQSDQTYNANSDEHFEHGRLTEDAEEVKLMMEKRMNKMNALKAELPEPELYGEEEGDVLFIGWGSPKNTVLDAISEQSTINNQQSISYLHYEYVFPVKTEKLMQLKERFRKVVLIENNYMGQLGDLIKIDCGYEFEHRLLKYDGRPFFVEDIIGFINNIN